VAAERHPQAAHRNTDAPAARKGVRSARRDCGGVDPDVVTTENAGVDEIVGRLRSLGFAAEKVGAEIHVVTVGVLLVVSEHRERFAVRIASNDQVTRICFDAKEVVAEVLNWRRLR
jgi:hypothetical protein